MMQERDTNIQLNALSTGYNRRHGAYVVSKDLNLSIPSSQVVMLMGPNGSGKSTLMHTIAGLLPPLGGEVLIQGHSLNHLSMKEIANLLSLVLTEKIIPGNMTVSDIVTVGRYPYTNYIGTLSSQDKELIHEAIHECRLQGMERRLYAELSDGERQRVMIARALTQATPLILLDEPTAHLDLPSRLEVIMMLRRLAHQKHKSILISTHEMDLAINWADTIWLMDRDGKITAGAPEDIVLGGHFERVFGTPTLEYDAERGEFSVRPEMIRTVSITGQGLRYTWTKRALQRVGFSETTPAQGTPHIEVTPDHWTLLVNGTISSHHDIASLLNTLKNSL
ncbi:ABC transporter ATP-binding protein [Porphyromonas sp.]|uniref:ABC transporter ATP-binding protein n=1 Tax=Porphyromonas sp. TaxID=1924944 RepID=UPI0026DD98D8|nr:ABC transporter ATP-binding protein [Porphyromonas sp.]MDO4771311.1 ABC transporter ATP-binding protein [Porphyromonas sp.]